MGANGRIYFKEHFERDHETLGKNGFVEFIDLIGFIGLVGLESIVDED